MGAFYTDVLLGDLRSHGNINRIATLRSQPFRGHDRNPFYRQSLMRAMPTPPTTASSRKTFRQRYDELETRRAALIARLNGFGETARQHPAYARALKLLNDTFRKGRLAQRLAVLEAAAWLINLLEKLTAIS